MKRRSFLKALAGLAVLPVAAKAGIGGGSRNDSNFLPATGAAKHRKGINYPLMPDLYSVDAQVNAMLDKAHLAANPPMIVDSGRIHADSLWNTPDIKWFTLT